jgi:paraquat-inducible protein B
LGSLSEGTPVFFRQLQAGQVVSYELDTGGQFLNVSVFVQSPYDQFVTSDTRFWNASGIDLSLSASGLHVQTESLLSILAGGIAFETPAASSHMPPAAADAAFTLFDNRAEAFDPPVQDPYVYRLVFRQSIRGLSVGAPVQLAGVTIGAVTQISPQFDEAKADFTVPATVCVDPERYGVRFLNLPAGADAMATHKKVMDALVARGMRARLKSGNLLTGAMYVSVDFFTNEPAVALDWSQNPVELPTMPGSEEALEENVNQLITSLNQIVLTARGTLTNADDLLGNANKLIEPNSALDAELNDLLVQGGDAARAVRVLADYLERHPEALIRGKTKEAK